MDNSHLFNLKFPSEMEINCCLQYNRHTRHRNKLSSLYLFAIVLLLRGWTCDNRIKHVTPKIMNHEKLRLSTSDRSVEYFACVYALNDR